MFKEVMPRTIVRNVTIGDFIYVTNEMIKFSYSFWETELRKSTRVRLFYDATTSEVGIKPILDPNELGGYKVLGYIAKHTLCIRWRKLVRSLNLHFDESCAMKITNLGDPKETMRIFKLNCKKSNGD